MVLIPGPQLVHHAAVIAEDDLRGGACRSRRNEDGDLGRRRSREEVGLEGVSRESCERRVGLSSGSGGGGGILRSLRWSGLLPRRLGWSALALAGGIGGRGASRSRDRHETGEQSTGDQAHMVRPSKGSPSDVMRPPGSRQ